MKNRVGVELRRTVSDQNVLLDEVPRINCGALEMLRCENGLPAAAIVSSFTPYLLKGTSLVKAIQYTSASCAAFGVWVLDEFGQVKREFH